MTNRRAIDKQGDGRRHAPALGNVRRTCRPELKTEDVIAFGKRPVGLHLEALVGDIIVTIGELPVLHVKDKAAIDAAHREQHTVRPTLGYVGVDRHPMRHIDQARSRVTGYALSAGIINVLLAIDRDLRPLLGEALHTSAIDWHYLILAGLDVPHADHRNQPIALRLREIVGFCKIFFEIVELPPLGIELNKLVVIDWRPEGQTRLGKRGTGPWAHGPPSVVVKGAMTKHLEVLRDM